MCKIRSISRTSLGLLLGPGLAQRKGRLLCAGSFRHTSLFNPHNLPRKQGPLFFSFYGWAS